MISTETVLSQVEACALASWQSDAVVARTDAVKNNTSRRVIPASPVIRVIRCLRQPARPPKVSAVRTASRRTALHMGNYSCRRIFGFPTMVTPVQRHKYESLSADFKPVVSGKRFGVQNRSSIAQHPSGGRCEAVSQLARFEAYLQ